MSKPLGDPEVLRSIGKAVDAGMPLAERLFRTLRERTKDVAGVTRAAYGEGEQTAHELLGEAAASLGLEVTTDYAANLYMTLPGRDRSGHGVIAGSHLDSVPRGGNYDGAAGVVAALSALAAISRIGLTPARNLTAMATRGEESAWFSTHHIGSRAALGLLPAEELDEARHIDSGRTLTDHMAEVGADVEALRAGRRWLDPKAIDAYFELHIEQGPVLVHKDLPVGIVTGIRGNVRARHGRCIGEYAHSGATPMKLRRDAVMAVAEYVGFFERTCQEIERDGGDLVVNFGKFFTDGDVHTHSKVPGRVSFTIDIRSHDLSILDRMNDLIIDQAKAIGDKRRLEINLGPITRVKPAIMDRKLCHLLQEVSREMGVRAMETPSGGGHDAGDFANIGVPSAMIFVRNPNGSHNPDEDMTMEDFAAGTRLLAGAMAAKVG